MTNTKTQHTPTNAMAWAVLVDGITHYVGAKGDRASNFANNFIAGGGEGHVEVVPLTIASPATLAAPDLLAACEAAHKALENMTSEDFSRGADQPIRELLRLAIARARGEA